MKPDRRVRVCADVVARTQWSLSAQCYRSVNGVMIEKTIEQLVPGMRSLLLICVCDWKFPRKLTLTHIQI
jgi:hypothetical protein